ncbi:MAG: Na/Pi cotransporter family protein [Lachnospiraceae bacterium]|nr:Na/Pi cotransporter family protein [Lachnospiraceae bacterium]
MDWSILLNMCGGLGLFLFGMKLMSEAIEKSAGAKLRSILEFFTKNKFSGLIVGIIFTAIIQSSSACTVMVVSFVNAGLMTLYQAVGVIMGANIGTTITSQLVSFNLSKFAPLFLLAGVIMVMFVKKDGVKKFGEILLGFGVLFLGLSLMSTSMAGIKENPNIAELFSSMTNPFLAVLLGLVLTSIVQSSSVTVSISLLMAQQGLLDLPVCLFIILGCNMGACTSALLASLAGMKDAKRAAMIHFLFNLVGTIIVFVILMFFKGPVVEGILAISGQNAGRFVANSHSLIKIFQVIVLFPFSSLLVKATYLVIPGDDKTKVGYNDNFQLQFIGQKTIFNPATAVVDVTNELERMAHLATDNLNRAMNVLVTLDEDEMNEVFEVEKNINFLNHQIVNYLVKLTQSTVPVEDMQSIGGLFHVVGDIERIGDHATNIAEAAKIRKEDNVEFSKNALEELREMMDLVNKNLYLCIEMFTHKNEEHMAEIEENENKIDLMERAVQQAHVERLTKNECSPEAGMIFTDIIAGLERVADHATNIAFATVNNN